ncbi:unnamed protein product [Rotaria sp. Silwood1]|nr:unnamed protein product [Rotaria sp. Silwood1]CAF1614845.1 unnamed protein product [Rotaria sp. Silwood1]CAF3691683.1 unnamed protein product [Rotaria sp. Silwood1]CAF4674171.1 unnamed protein product [Rotaria sp. Silwood1]CAF5127405.1 unnamed protein product [Rotaria sp. Silwood1]
MPSFSINNGLHSKYSNISQIIYLDNNATTCEDKSVIESMVNHLKHSNSFGNPNNSHLIGIQTRYLIDEAREQVRNLINASDTNEIIFTSGSIQPIEEIVNICRKYNSSDIIIHSDALQSIGKVSIDVSRLGIKLKSILYGAQHEYDLRSGTENVLAIIDSTCHEDTQHQTISTTLQTIGLSYRLARSTIRLSTSYMTTDDELDQAIILITNAFKQQLSSLIDEHQFR